MKSLKQLASRIKALVSANPIGSDEAIAKTIFVTLKDGDVRDLAIMQLKEMVWNWKRSGQLVVERQSVSDSDAWMKAALKNPATVYGKPGTPKAPIPSFSNQGNREKFAKFAGARLNKWLSRAKSVAAKSGMSDVFTTEWKSKDIQQSLSSDNQLLEAIRGIVNDMKNQIKLELTAELLSTEFAIGNGQRVTWGKATQDQHQLRIEMLLKNASANTDAAARHAKAIELLQSSGAQCLAKIKS